MEGIKFTDYECQVFSNLFAVCDEDNTGHISGTGKVSELFLSSGLSQETLQQVNLTCFFNSVTFGASLYLLKCVTSLMTRVTVFIFILESRLESTVTSK